MNGLIIKDLLNVEIKGSGTAFPESGRWVENDEIHQLIHGDNWREVMKEKELTTDYYEKDMGFKKRFWVHTPGNEITHNEITSADLMAEAAEAAIADAGINKKHIDFVITVTITSPRYSTSMGPVVSNKLGIKAPAIEMKTGCATHLFSLVMAAQMIQSGARNVLIAGGETTTKILKPKSNMVYAGGDAGAAVIVSKSESNDKGILAAVLNTDGTFSTHMGVTGMLPPNKKDFEEENYFLTYSDAAEQFLNHAWLATPAQLYFHSGLRPKDMDCLIPHQILRRRTEFASTASEIPMFKTVNILSEFANCSSTTLLLALHHARKSKMIKEDEHAMLLAAGGGISWGGLILKT